MSDEESSGQLTPNQRFEEKVKERITKDIGDLLPDEMLSEMVSKTMTSLFFEDHERKDSYGRVLSVKPAFIKTVVSDLLKDQVKESISKWLEDHPEEVIAAVTQTVQGGIFGAIRSHIDRVTASDTHNYVSNALDSLGIQRR